MTRRIKAQINLKDAVAIYVLDCESRRLTTKTVFFYRTSLQTFVTWAATVGVSTLAEITPTTIRQFQVHLADRGLSAVYQHNLARALRTFCNFAVAERLIASSPFQNIKLPILPKRILPALTPDEERRLLRAATVRNRAIILFALRSGVRVEELCSLNVGLVDLASGAVQVINGKGQKSRITYIDAQARKALRLYLASRGELPNDAPLFISERGARRCTTNAIVQVMLKLQAKTGITYASFHTLRRTFAINCLRSGMNIHVLARLMGHADIQVLRRYLDMSEGDAAAEYASRGPGQATS